MKFNVTMSQKEIKAMSNGSLDLIDQIPDIPGFEAFAEKTKNELEKLKEPDIKSSAVKAGDFIFRKDEREVAISATVHEQCTIDYILMIFRIIRLFLPLFTMVTGLMAAARPIIENMNSKIEDIVKAFHKKWSDEKEPEQEPAEKKDESEASTEEKISEEKKTGEKTNKKKHPEYGLLIINESVDEHRTPIVSVSVVSEKYGSPELRIDATKNNRIEWSGVASEFIDLEDELEARKLAARDVTWVSDDGNVAKVAMFDKFNEILCAASNKKDTGKVELPDDSGEIKPSHKDKKSK